MNKLFTKVATLCVGLAMAAGVGAAVGASGVSETKAAGTYTISLIPNQENTGRTETSYITTAATFIYDSVSWTMNQWNPSSLQVKTNQASATGEFYFYMGEVPGPITSVVMTFSALTVATGKESEFYIKGSSTAFNAPATSDGTSMVWNSEAKTLSWSAEESSGFKAISFYQNGKVATGTNKITSIDVTYVGSKPSPVTTYDIIFHENGENVVNMPTTQSVLPGETSIVEYKPRRAGYHFVGWSLSEDGAVVSSVTITDAAVNVYAIWEARTPLSGTRDVLNYDSVGVEGSSYLAWSEKSFTSSAVYTGNSAGGGDDKCVQLRSGTSKDSTIHSGIVTTTSGGTLYGVEVEWNALAATDRCLDVYGSNEPYSSVEDLYVNASAGDLLGSIKCGTSEQLVVSGEYSYVGLRSKDGAEYFDEIVVVWTSETPVPPVEDKYTVSFFEGSTESSTGEYAEGAKVAIPQPTESLIPEGKEFDYWEHKESGDHYAPGVEFTVGTSNARFDAVYKDVEPVVEDWDPTLKTQFENELDGFVPPFVAAFSGEDDIAVYEGSNMAYGFVAENVVSDITSAFVTAEYGQPTEDEGGYTYSIPTTNGTVEVEYGYTAEENAGTYFILMYVEAITGEWSLEQQTQMTDNVGLVLPYLGDDFAAALTLVDSDPSDVYFQGEVEGYKISSIYTAFANAEWDYYWLNEETNNYFFTNPTKTGTAVFQCGAYQASETEIRTFFYYFFMDYRGIIEFSDSLDVYVGDSISDLDLNLALVNTEMEGFSIDPTKCEYSVDSFESAGEMTVYVYYNYFYGSFTVDVQEVVATGLSLDASKVKSSYEIGDQFDPTGLEIKLNFNNGSSQDLSIDDVEISGFDSEVAGEKTITVKYEDFTETFKVTVNEYVPVMEGIQVTKNPTKVVYEVGESFDPSGIEVSAVYDVGDPVVVDLEDVTFSGFDSATAGKKTITVSYGNFSTTFNVTVEKAAYTAEQFAEEFLAEVAKVCANYDGKKNNKTALSNVWTKMSARYDELSSEEKTKIANATPKADGDAIQRMLTFYNYACKKYGLTKFISTQKSSLVISSTETTNNNLPIIVIVASAIAAVTAIGVVIGLKRRKNFLAK